MRDKFQKDLLDIVKSVEKIRVESKAILESLHSVIKKMEAEETEKPKRIRKKW